MTEHQENQQKLDLEAWAKTMSSYEAVDWEHMPEIYLYMDQVLTYMNKQLRLFERNDTDAPLTSSMINNYVKSGVVDRPEQKKYNRDHLAVLTIVCLLKSVLSIQDISTLLENLLEHNSQKQVYQDFCAAQSNAYQEVCGRVLDAIPKGRDELFLLAAELSAEAKARRSAAERILCELKESPEKYSHSGKEE